MNKKQTFVDGVGYSFNAKDNEMQQPMQRSGSNRDYRETLLSKHSQAEERLPLSDISGTFGRQSEGSGIHNVHVIPNSNLNKRSKDSSEFLIT